MSAILDKSIMNLIEPRALIAFDADGHIQEFSPSAYRMFDYSEDEFSHLTFENLFHWERIGKRPSQILEEMMYHGGQIRDMEMPALRKGEVVFPALVTMGVADGGGFLLLLEDSSARLRLLKELKEEKRRLESALAISSYRIENLQDALEKRTQELEESDNRLDIYSRLISYITSVWEEDFLIAGVLELLVLLEVAHAGVIHIYDPDRHVYILKGAVGVKAESLPKEHGVESGVWSVLYEHKKRMLLPNAAGLFSIDTPLGKWTPGAILAIPLEYHGVFIGVTTLALVKPVTQDEQLFYENLMAHVAIGIYNIRQYANLRNMAEKLHAQAEEIEDKNRLLEEVSRRRSVFIANMTHELRTPLNIILGFTEVLEEQLDDSRKEEALPILQEIRSAGNQLLGIVEDILALSRIETGDLSLNPEVASLNEFLEAVLSPWAEKAKNLEIELEYTLPEEEYIAELDFVKIRQTLTALLSNALKFTMVGGHVFIDASVSGRNLRITVRDTGVGISKEDQQIIFEAFRQGSAAMSKPSGGTGIGLTLAKHYVELHGGTIRVESQEGMGATFIIDLPDVIIV